MSVTDPRRLFDLMRDAAHKIKLRAKRPPDPSKWPLDGVDADGNRDWRKCSVQFLLNKLDEEVAELKRECVPGAQLNHVRFEAGDVAAVTMMLADRLDAYGARPVMPKIVCLCGSTKFKEQFETANRQFTFAGYIVLSVGFFMHREGETIEDWQKANLDTLHKRKIDLCDEVFVINVDGYVGSSTRSEIDYAHATSKPVSYLEQIE